MHKLFLDIETLPAADDKIGTLRMFFDKKHSEFEQEKFDDFLRRTSFDGAFGRILCIGYATDNESSQVFYNENNEKETLRQFWDLVNALSISPPNNNLLYPDYGVLFVGHNIMDFDLRFIYQRSIVLGVKPAYEMSFARYRNYPIFDTMKEWVKWNNVGVSLECLAIALDIPSPKNGIDGSQVAELYKKGRANDILEYCKKDVETARNIYRKITFEKKSKTLF